MIFLAQVKDSLGIAYGFTSPIVNWTELLHNAWTLSTTHVVVTQQPFALLQRSQYHVRDNATRASFNWTFSQVFLRVGPGNSITTPKKDHQQWIFLWLLFITLLCLQTNQSKLWMLETVVRVPHGWLSCCGLLSRLLRDSIKQVVTTYLDFCKRDVISGLSLFENYVHFIYIPVPYVFNVYCDDLYKDCGYGYSNCNDTWWQMNCPATCNLCKGKTISNQAIFSAL